MLNGKYISSLEIVRNVMRDTQSAENVQWQDSIEWCAEALDLIAVPKSLVNKIAAIEINDYRGDLPCDFEQMVQCSGLTNGCVQFPMRETTNTFHPVFTCNTTIAQQNSTTNTYSTLIDSATPIGEDADGNPTFNFINDGNVSLSKHLVNNTGTNCPSEPTYRLSEGYIFTSFKNDYKVLIAYKAFPIDKNGYPLIPDNIKFKQAVQSYVRMKVDYILWRKNLLEKAVFDYSEREWMWYCGAATTAGHTPSIDSMESWKNQMLRLIPKINNHSTFFKDLGSQERLIMGRKY